MKENKKIITELQQTGKFMIDHQLAWGTAGNISARTTGEEFLITASGTYLGELNEEDVIIYPGTSRQTKRPSKEFPMHEAIYKKRSDINAILHSSPFYSTLLACSDLEIPSNYFVETMYYLERVHRVRYEHPGSIELAEAVREKANTANIFLLENHGVLVCDTSIKEALMAVQTLEFAAKMLITALEKNIEIKGLTNEVITDFLENAGYKPRRNW
ncbi:class II aldolase/adducin family protein [Alteribacillus sp. YIM 98480]|uniref:class II aldolase/adducin family protein n=1 Tax=Alteribacillus sp. YIM 98480 TaxID=2606599 RepID=UPI001E4E8F3B|nr:class II aldolase/adducin family protein [Alteribacillus sp. YIM 98480]